MKNTAEKGWVKIIMTTNITDILEKKENKYTNKIKIVGKCSLFNNQNSYEQIVSLTNVPPVPNWKIHTEHCMLQNRTYNAQSTCSVKQYMAAL